MIGNTTRAESASTEVPLTPKHSCRFSSPAPDRTGSCRPHEANHIEHVVSAMKRLSCASRSNWAAR